MSRLNLFCSKAADQADQLESGMLLTTNKNNTSGLSLKTNLLIGAAFFITAAAVLIYFLTRKSAVSSAENNLSGSLVLSTASIDVLCNVTNYTVDNNTIQFCEPINETVLLTHQIGQLACNALKSAVAPLFWALVQPFINASWCIPESCFDNSSRLAELCEATETDLHITPPACKPPIGSCPEVSIEIVQAFGEFLCANNSNKSLNVAHQDNFTQANRSHACKIHNGSLFNNTDKNCFLQNNRWQVEFVPDANTMNSLR